MVAVGNGPTYGGWMYMCPKARLNDGLFHISIIEMGRCELLYKFNTMYSRSLYPDTHLKEFLNKTVKIEMIDITNTPYIAHVDGEIIGNLPVQYETVSNAYEFIKPEKNEAEIWFMEKYGKKFHKHLQKLRKKGSKYYENYEFS